MSAQAAAAVDSKEFFEGLAAVMNAHPERFEPLGWFDLDLGVVIDRDLGDPLMLALRFRGSRCEDVRESFPADTVDCIVQGPRAAWAQMVDDIVAHGHATGRQTLSSLVLLGETIKLHGSDPLGVDRFFRVAESVQRFFDGAGEALSAAVGSATRAQTQEVG
jgi:hypothetical protein